MTLRSGPLCCHVRSTFRPILWLMNQASLTTPPLTLGTSPVFCPHKALEVISQGTISVEILGSVTHE